ncbi:hypothetical protein [Nocardia sp. NPDC127526]|uniref:hypothetical protein n=1 Tax=Nocardia sp. NPDC127526 TaxID=3345393 RepID=UPI00363DFCC3
MARTTPPRPVDIASVFPELAPLVRRAVRLHPRFGLPTEHDSSIGGRLLWPADEEWPVCAQEHIHWDLPQSLANIRRLRMLEGARDRIPPQYLADLRTGHPAHDEPNAMLPVAQLYFEDIPGLTGPEGTDLLQVLWCPLDHEKYFPATRLVWRSSGSVHELLTDPPEPADVEQFGSYVLDPCVLHPEVVSEYPAPLELPKELAQRLRDWGDRYWAEEDPEWESSPGSAYYQYELSVAPGWKVGGWGPWSFCDPQPMNCEVCDAEYRPLLTISSGEWQGGSRSWIPLEDRRHPLDTVGLHEASNQPRVIIGRGYHMQIYVCPTSFDHPHFENMQ